jgi:hypothetical protein
MKLKDFFKWLSIGLLSLLILGCSASEELSDDDEWPDQNVIKAQAFHLIFNEPMDIQTALDTANYLVIDNIGQVIKINSVHFVKSIFIDTAWVDQQFGTSVALFPMKQLYAGIYTIEIYDVEDTSGNAISPNPTFIQVRYKPDRIKYWDIKTD